MNKNMIEDKEMSKIEEGRANDTVKENVASPIIEIAQKMLAEAIGTFYLMFVSCGAIAVDKIYGSVTFPGICVTWGLMIMVMIYAVGHISGAHFNPAVSIALSIFNKFPIRLAPFYIVAQVAGATLASYILSLIFDVTPDAYFGTVPLNSNWQSLVIEIVVSSILMFVISGAVADERGVKGFGGVAVGMTITACIFCSGKISGGSLNPARSLGPSFALHHYQSWWVYILGPIVGTVVGGGAYKLLKISF